MASFWKHLWGKSGEKTKLRSVEEVGKMNDKECSVYKRICSKLNKGFTGVVQLLFRKELMKAKTQMTQVRETKHFSISKYS